MSESGRSRNIVKREVIGDRVKKWCRYLLPMRVYRSLSRKARPGKG